MGHNGLLQSPEFATSRAVLPAKRKILKGQGLGNRPNKAADLTDLTIEKFWDSGELGKASAKTIQNTLFFS